MKDRELKPNSKSKIRTLTSNHKGITLIALIITIIVMLILVGVTVSIAINGGLFSAAKDAASRTQIAKEKEQIMAGYSAYQMARVQGEEANLEVAGATVTGNETDGWIITFEETGNTYKLYPDGRIEKIEEEKPAELTDIYVTLYEDGTLGFSNNTDKIAGKEVSKEYGNIKGQTYTTQIDSLNNRIANTPWFDERDAITSVDFFNEIVPENISTWFLQCTNLKIINNIENLNTMSVSDMKYTFYKCSSLENIDVTKLNTCNVTDMRSLFFGCESLMELNLNSFDTSKVVDMGCMFKGATSLKNIIGLEKFNTKNVKDMGNMFQDCLALTSLNLKHFDTSNVTDMGFMFMGSDTNRMRLKSIEGLDTFDTNNVNNMCGMFDNCSELTELDLSSFNTNLVEDMSYMFYHCSNLEKLNMNSFNTSNVKTMMSMFENCSNLSQLDLSSFDTSNVTNMRWMFFGCSNTKLIYGSKDKWSLDKVTDDTEMWMNCGTNQITYKAYQEGNKLVGYEIVKDGEWMSNSGNIGAHSRRNGNCSYTPTIVTLDPDKTYKIKMNLDNITDSDKDYYYQIFKVSLDLTEGENTGYVQGSQETQITGQKYIVINVHYRQDRFKKNYR